MKAIKTKYICPTNFRGSRVKATDMDTNHITLTWSDELNSDENHKMAARALCKKMGWEGRLAMGGFPEFNVHVFVEEER